jgi:hypothetical protein
LSASSQALRTRADIGQAELVGDGVTQGVEEPAAAVDVAPALGLDALDVLALEQEGLPVLVGGVDRVADQVSLAAVAELDLRAVAAVGASMSSISISPSARRRRRPLRR